MLALSTGGGLAIILGVVVAVAILGFLGHWAFHRVTRSRRVTAQRRPPEHPRGRAGV